MPRAPTSRDEWLPPCLAMAVCAGVWLVLVGIGAVCLADRAPSIRLGWWLAGGGIASFLAALALALLADGDEAK